jgi:hypothetical protein
MVLVPVKPFLDEAIPLLASNSSQLRFDSCSAVMLRQVVAWMQSSIRRSASVAISSKETILQSLDSGLQLSYLCSWGGSQGIKFCPRTLLRLFATGIRPQSKQVRYSRMHFKLAIAIQ